jgi:hypothetical protein
MGRRLPGSLSRLDVAAAALVLATATAVIILRVGGGPGVADPAPAPPAPRVLMAPDEAARRIERARTGAREDERPAFADGTISADEYRDAVRRTTTCLREAVEADARAAGLSGITLAASEPVLSPDGFEVTYRFEIDAARPGTMVPDDAAARVEQREIGCQEAHQRHVEAAFQARLLADAAFVAAVEEGYRRCASEAGVPVAPGVLPRDLILQARSAGDPADAARRLRPCSTNYPSINHLPAPVPQ